MNTAGTDTTAPTSTTSPAATSSACRDGLSPLEKVDREAIVGGTGVYANARGTVETRWLAKDFSKAAVTFTLEP